MRQWVRGAVLVALLAVAPLRAQQPASAPAVRDPNLAERAYIAATAYHVIKRYFAHAEGLPADFDFEARYRAYLAEALAAPDRRSFSLASIRFFAALRNGHTGFSDSRLTQDVPRSPFRVALIDGKWTVTSARLATLNPGDVIVKVDGKPVAEWLAPIRPYVGVSNVAQEERYAWNYRAAMPRQFTLGTDDGRGVAVNLAAVPDVPLRGRVVPDDVTVTKRPDGVLVIRIPSFDDPRFENAAVAAVKAAGDARAILFDVRGNGGGSTPSRLLAAIMTRPYRGTLYVTPLTVAESDAHQVFDGGVPALPNQMIRIGSDRTEPQPGAWAGKAAVLMDGGCGSACEDFVLRFQDGKRGPILGETSVGSTGQPYFMAFPEFGMSFRVSTKREYFPDGAPFEGVGVRPDQVIAPTRAEVRAGVDTQLETAVRLILAP